MATLDNLPENNSRITRAIDGPLKYSINNLTGLIEKM